MNLGMTEKISCLVNDVRDLVNNRIIPFEAEFFAEVAASSDRFSYSKRMTEILETLKSEARAKGLWNFGLQILKKGLGCQL